MIKVYSIPFNKVPFFSKRDKDYTCQPELFKDYISELPNLDGLIKQVSKKAQHPINRSLLVERLKLQFAKLESNALVNNQIQKLHDDKTFTVCTAHQPILFGGPLYVVYKAISAIKLAGIMKEHMPDHEFVPVFVVGEEDHDFDEINHTTINGQLIEWKEKNGKGSVGHYPTSEIVHMLKELKSLLPKNDLGNSWWNKLQGAYEKHSTFGLATQELLHELFADLGMLVIRLDEPPFKQRFVPFMVKEVEEKISEILISKTLESLKGKGYKPQAKPRSINLFYRNEMGRHRVRTVNGRFFIDDSENSLSQQEIVNKIKAESSSFSPNVIMRPIFQELILPNIAYVGGGGELAYWTERKAQFDYFDIPLPVLVRRDSAVLIASEQGQLFSKLSLNWIEFFTRIEDLVKNRLDGIIDEELMLKEKQNEIIARIDQLIKDTSFKDEGITRSIESEKSKIFKSLKNIESKIRKGYGLKEKTLVSDLRKIHEYIFPGHNGMQERVNNIHEIYTLTMENLFSVLMNSLNPLEKEVTLVVIEEDI